MKGFIIFGIAIFLSACSANMQALGGKTQRGFVDRSSYRLGEVLLWDQDSKRLQPLSLLRELRIDIDGHGTTDDVNFSSEIRFGGNINLTAAQIDALEIEVTSRTTAKITDFVTRQFYEVAEVFEENWDADGDKWTRLTELRSDGTPVYVVIVDDQTLATKLEIEVSEQTAAGGSFESSVRGPFGGNLDFSIIDTGAINRDAVDTGQRSVVFFEPTIIRIRVGQDGNPKFSTTQVEPSVRAEIEAYLLR